MSSSKKDSGDEEKERAYTMSSMSKQVSMINCYNQLRFLFDRERSVHFKVLIAYWMMWGFTERARSVEEAYRKGCESLIDLIHKDKILKISNNEGFIEFIKGSTASCRHEGSCNEFLSFSSVVDLDRIRKVVLSDQILSSKSKYDHGGLKYLVHFNPNPQSLQPLLEKANSPSVLVLRGFEEDLSLYCFPALDRLKTLTALEISDSTRLPIAIHPHTFSQLENLEFLNLSHLPIQGVGGEYLKIPSRLQRLILRGCSKLSFVEIDNDCQVFMLDLSHCTTLQSLTLGYRVSILDLSYTTDHLKIFKFPKSRYLSSMYLKGTTILMPEFRSYLNQVDFWKLDLSSCEYEELDDFLMDIDVKYLMELNLSGCVCLTKLDEGHFNQMSWLEKLDLSWTKLKHLPSLAELIRLRKLSLRGLELDSLETLASLSKSLEKLDLEGIKISSSQEFKLDFLQSLENLQFLNLSQTSVEKLPNMSKLVRLKELLLADCQRLKVVPDLRALTNLETLDLSLPNDSSINTRQLEFENDGLPTSLQKLVLTNRSNVQTLFPLAALDNLDILDLRGTGVVGWESKLAEAQQSVQEIIPKPVEVHILSIDDESNNQQSNQEYSSVEKVFIQWDALISDIHKNLSSTIATNITAEADNRSSKTQLEKLHADLRYIQEKIDRLKNSNNWKSCKELLQELVDAATNLSGADFVVDSAYFKQLKRTIVKLKILVPVKHTENSEAFETINKKKKKSPFIRSQNNDNAVVADIFTDTHVMSHELLTSYQSLSLIQKKCLLCFSIFPHDGDKEKNTRRLVIKKKTLIYWWVGEGFIDLRHEEDVDTDPNPNPKTIEETGKQILEVLTEKGFIEPVMKKRRESASFSIHPFVHTFVIERAKEESFFDFDQETDKLTPRFTCSRRACLLKPHDRFPSSCKLWGNFINSPKKLESFKNVQTLFNVNESVIDIKREWFSKMKDLSVLHLGIWNSENADQVELQDHKFLEDLKGMKQLRLLSLQGLPTIMKLPDSVCRLSNLMILDLKECTYLEELPAGIGSLKSLTHLDLSNCPLLYKLPKGIRLLSKLEVLKGFVITDLYAARGSKKTKQRKNNEVCTITDLGKLEMLRELSIVVNISEFPDEEDIKVFKEMKNLCKLKILWETSFSSEEVIKSATEQDTLTGPSRWHNKLKCWKRRQQSHIDGDDSREENKLLDNIEKLELWCFPHETIPYWLNPREVKNLKKLYIVGGNLRKLNGSRTDENRWNVEILRLKYLRHLNIQWPEMKIMFPRLL